MNAQVIQMDTIPIVMLRHQGSYDAIGPVFDSLFQWVTAGGVPVGRTIGIYWDNPDYVSASRLRSAACAEVPPDFRLTDPGGLPLEISEIAAGRFVTTRFVGPYEELAPVWSQLTQ
jgi:AraC family transcriptional regulator